MKFGEKLQTLRRAKGLSQEQLSEALGVTRQAISKWELNASLPDVEKLLALSEFFEVSTDYLLKETMETPTPAAPPTTGPLSAPYHRHINKKLLVGGILTGISSLTLFIVWILSRVFPANYSVSNPMHGYIQFWSGYGGFVRTHRLRPLTIPCWILLFVGLGLLWTVANQHYSLWPRIKNWFDHGSTES